MPDTQTGSVNWGFGHWKFDYAVSDSEGLSLLNGSYRGFPIFGKFSMPVIRVKYLQDGGWHDCAASSGPAPARTPTRSGGTWEGATAYSASPTAAMNMWPFTSPS